MKKRCLILAGLLLSAQVLSVAPAIAETEDTVVEEVMEEAAKETIDVIEVVEDAEEAEEGEDAEAAESAESAEAAEDAEEAVEEVEEKVRPEFDFHEYLKELGTYKGQEVEVAALVEITDEMVQNEISLRMDTVKEDITEGKVETGDIANIDYEGKKDDVAFAGGTAAGYDLAIGSGTFIPGFEEGLVGVGIGETVDLNLTFPEEYHSEELAGAEVVFTVTVNSVQRAMEYSDAAVEKLSDGEHTDMASYEAAVREELENDSKESQKIEAENLFWKNLLESTEFNGLPEDVIDYDVEESIAYNRNLLMYYYGMNLEDYLAMQGGTLEDFEASTRETTEIQVKVEILEQAILEAEGVEISEDEFREFAETYAEQYGYDVDTFLELAGEADLWKNLRYEKAAEVLMNNNSFTEIAAE